ncbi:MAG: LTA synthase family protein [Saprospiraceae bacterium]
MAILFYNLRQLSKQLAVLVLLYAVGRAIFMLIHHQSFEWSGPIECGLLFVKGLRFDLSAIAMTNLLYLWLFFLAFFIPWNKFYSYFCLPIFLISNGLALAFNLSDVAYFPFVLKRTQADVLDYFSGEKGNDFFRLIPTFIQQYYFLIIVFLLFILLLYVVGKRSKPAVILSVLEGSFIKNFIFILVIWVVVNGLFVVAFRGGFQAKPLNIIHASEMTKVANIPAILNTPFSILKTWGKKSISTRSYFPEEQILQAKDFIHHGDTCQTFDKKNIVIIILESMSKHYIGKYSQETKTPFLDSLIGQSMMFTNAFANARESVQGIPAIISSIPSWQDEPFIFSPYASNKITSLPSVLKEEGYTSYFFHGAFNGTMGFDSYAGLAGFDQYFGKDEYNNEQDYDGKWGIWDEPFLQFTAKKLSATTQPFFASIFTLNPHHPFIIPEKYRDKMASPIHPFFSCVEYIDYSLSQFFKTIQNESWFDNTLFVFVADHTAPILYDKKVNPEVDNVEPDVNPMNDYRIPLFFYQPNGKTLGEERDILANQIDILPTLLHWIHYPKSFYSLGRNLLDSQQKNDAITYNNQVYQYINQNYCYHFNGENPVALYAWQKDPFLKNNLIKNTVKEVWLPLDSLVKNRIQQFNLTMSKNMMFDKNGKK